MVLSVVKQVTESRAGISMLRRMLAKAMIARKTAFSEVHNNVKEVIN